MPIVLDTNTLIRFFTNDDPKKAEKVQRLFEAEAVLVPDVVFPELEYVLESTYALPRNKILDAYRFLVESRNIKTSPYMQKAVALYEQTILDMADCIIGAQSLKTTLASFDKDLLGAPAIKPFWKI